MPGSSVPGFGLIPLDRSRNPCYDQIPDRSTGSQMGRHDFQQIVPEPQSASKRKDSRLAEGRTEALEVMV